MLQLPPRFFIPHLMQDTKQRVEGISQNKNHHNDFKNGDDNEDVREQILHFTNAVPTDTRMLRDNVIVTQSHNDLTSQAFDTYCCFNTSLYFCYKYFSTPFITGTIKPPSTLHRPSFKSHAPSQATNRLQ